MFRWKLAGIVVILLLIGLELFYIDGKSVARGRANSGDIERSFSPLIQPGKIYIKLSPAAANLLKGQISTLSSLQSFGDKFQKYSMSSIEKAFRTAPDFKSSPVSGIDRIYLMHFADEFNPLAVAEEFSQAAGVEYAEPVYRYEVEEVPNDPYYNVQNHLPQINAEAAWGIEKGDSSVVIAIVDNGTDYTHPDLAANLWTNIAEANGVPGVDDDDNGYIDDIHGYDLSDDDNEPLNGPRDAAGYWLHGTHVAGIAAAVTDNGEGIASIGWNCSYMPIKTAPDDDPRYIYDGYEGLRYAAENGADIINASWGGFNAYSRVGQDMINYVYTKGCVIVASAGNSITDGFHYPSAFSNVLSVAWVDSEDNLEYIRPGVGGTYGISVDVCAPGTNIYSTIPFADGAYGSTGGSSMATPLVAGLCGLVKSQHPDWTNDQIVRQVALTADNIDAKNPAYAGLLGSGRINAYRALSETQLTEVPPKCQLLQFSVSDSAEGDADGLYEKGEIISVRGDWRNYSLGTATNAEFSLTTNDPFLTVLNGSIMYGTVPPDSYVFLEDFFSFRVNDDSRGHSVTLYLDWSADGGFGGRDSIKVVIGKLPVLIVDDDQFDPEYMSLVTIPDVEGFYTNLLDRWGVQYEYWRRVTQGTPPANELQRYATVIWSCGWGFPTLNESDREALAHYLDSGGNLFISGQDIGYDFNDPTGWSIDAQSFYTEYLHAVYVADESPVNEVRGIVGDPIGDKLEFDVYQPGLSLDLQYLDEIDPTAEATSIFEYLGGQHHKAGIKFAGTHKVVYLPYGFEAIDSEETTPDTMRSAARDEVMDRVLNWFGGFAHQPPRDTENPSRSHPVSCTVTGDAGQLTDISVRWRKNGEVAFNEVVLDSLGDGLYSGEIPAINSVGTVEYYIAAESEYFDWKTPFSAPHKLYTIHVGPDNVPPDLAPVQRDNTINGQLPYAVEVKVTDNIGVDTSSVFVYYTVNGSSGSAKMRATGFEHTFTGLIPPVAAYGDSVEYYFSAGDSSSNQNEAISPSLKFLVGYEDFEADLDEWVISPAGWGVDNTYAISGEYSINDSPGINYPNNANTALQLNFSLDLSETDNASLRFYTRYFLEIGHDYGYVEVSSDGGAVWELLGEPYNGVKIQYTEEERSLSNYCGPGYNDVRLRFRMESDSTQIPPFVGWFIDDVRILEGVHTAVATDQVDEALPDRFILYQNYPNPFNPATTISFHTPKATEVSIRIYNMLGREIKVLMDERISAGAHSVAWDGKNEDGVAVSAGIYFYRLIADSFTETRKMLYLK